MTKPIKFLELHYTMTQVLIIKYSQSLLVAQVKFESQVRFQFFFFSVFFFDYTNDVRAVTRNINFPVGNIFHSRSKEPLPLHIAVASPRYMYTITFNINTFSKNIKASNLHIPEEHVPFT